MFVLFSFFLRLISFSCFLCVILLMLLLLWLARFFLSFGLFVCLLQCFQYSICFAPCFFCLFFHSFCLAHLFIWYLCLPFSFFFMVCFCPVVCVWFFWCSSFPCFFLLLLLLYVWLMFSVSFSFFLSVCLVDLFAFVAIPYACPVFILFGCHFYDAHLPSLLFSFFVSFFLTVQILCFLS